MVSPSCLPKEDNLIDALIPRLLEYAPQYYDLSGFPDGETKRALQKANAKRLKLSDPQRAPDAGREKKRQKKACPVAMD